MKKWTLQNKEGIPKILVAAKGNLVTSYRKQEYLCQLIFEKEI